MKRVFAGLMVLALLAVLPGCEEDTEPTETAAPSLSTATAEPIPVPTEDPAEIATGEREELETEAAAVLSAQLGEEFPAREFLLWLESGKLPDIFEEVCSLPEGQDIKNYLWERCGESIYVLRDAFDGLLDSEETAAKAGIAFAPASENGEKTVIALAGDVNLMDGDYVMPAYRAAASGLSDIFTGGLLEELRAADILLVNNEFAFTSRGTALSGKGYNFRASPENVKILLDMGVDIAYLANNHVYDYGAEGLYDTLKTLREAGIPYIGAGMDLEEASRPVFFIAGGRKIAFIGAGCIERYELFTPGAGEDSPGIFRADEVNSEPLLSVIREAAECSDYVIVNLHWGIESTSVLEAYQPELGRLCIDAGADAVVGTHPHVLQGAEFYQGKPIIYSVGNFWFSETYNNTCLLELIVDEGGLAVRFLPCVTGGGKTGLVSGDEAARIWEDYERISFGVQIDADGFITET